MRQSFTEGLRLEECTLLDVVHQKRVIGRLKRVYAIDARKTVSKAITYMVDMDVNTIAVFKKDKANNEKYMSMVTSLDILYYLAWRKDKNAKTALISELAGLTEETKHLWRYPITTPLNSTVQPFTQGVHAILVDVENVLEDVETAYISQWDVVHFLYAKQSLFEDDAAIFAQPLNDKSLYNRMSDAISVNENDTLNKGLKLMSTKNLLGLAVVNNDGVLVSNLTADHSANMFILADLEDLDKLSIREALSGIGESYGAENVQNAVHKNAKLSELLALAMRLKAKRFWVVDKDGRPAKVVTLTDLIREVTLYRYYQDYAAR